eukprot:c10870_g1_i1 orf=146-304(-)
MQPMLMVCVACWRHQGSNDVYVFSPLMPFLYVNLKIFFSMVLLDLMAEHTIY